MTHFLARTRLVLFLRTNLIIITFAIIQLYILRKVNIISVFLLSVGGAAAENVGYHGRMDALSGQVAQLFLHVNQMFAKL